MMIEAFSLQSGWLIEILFGDILDTWMLYDHQITEKDHTVIHLPENDQLH